jgi:hypothetical protein
MRGVEEIIFQTLVMGRIYALRRARSARVYYEDELGCRSKAKMLTKDKARRIARNFAKLPD